MFEYLPLFYAGLWTTLLLWLGGLVLATLLGVVWAMLIWLKVPVLAQFASTFVLFVRSVPILVQIFYIFFLLPDIGIVLTPYWAVVFGLGLAFSAYMAEVFRAGILAIDRGQFEAATAMAMPQLLVARRIVLPQAIKTSLPGYANVVVMILKTTSLGSVIAVPEISRTAYLLVQSTLKSVEIFSLLALLYIAISVPLIVLIRRMERK
ncbi:amino acid ABC transporter permease [Haematobacter massiliensis]|uniref:Amino acid ABC transporter permease n=1 Tax=Haematobacter massiliensis TaxID=195105 RepID=A0A086Y6Y9_9RHOB|nr:amino acid ABC transporter permease [Haematobacter massiliensis]KFI30039.1 amino acid ABC transporter permease [Haematobacter massiliensis]OWJ69803.1 amino acid ABC transporter permease [Haematobacter massiliensis]OWJ82631.1 amino acid ABC transporter permease [Haematobacter massiliensis]QBJ25544.1 amino acid ABC transporter permease [Haematobacter massiliensis]